MVINHLLSAFSYAIFPSLQNFCSFSFGVSIYIIMYILDTSKAIKRFQSLKSSKTLPFNTSYDLRLNQLLENLQKLHITQAEKVSPNSSLYSDTKKSKIAILNMQLKVS